MNLIHRSIWNEQTGTCVAVAENTRSAGKKMSSCTSAGTGGHFRLKVLAVSLMLACGAGVQAQPTGGVVSSGSATIGGTPGQMTITQTTPQVAINWQSFGILAGDSVQFVQPGSSSVALNRVVGSDPSSILGSLTSNGQVFLVNPNGILFGQGASVSVGGLVASTLALSDADFTANRHQFAGAGAGSVVNQGHIQAADGGYVALLGANVSNQGVVAAQLGTVALAAGNAVTLDLAGDRLLQVTVDQGSVNALVDNGGMLRADGGQVLMTTQVAGSLLANAVNNTGMVQAQTLNNVRGTILLMGGMQSGTVQVGGTLDASAPAGGHGGFVETSAAHVKVADGARVTTLASAGTTGMWLIDPFDFNVSAAGGDITGAQLSVNLDSSNVTLESSGGATGTAGDVNVDAAVTWTAATALVLNAFNDVNINQAVTGTNGSLTANAGRNVNVSAATTTTTGNLSFNAVNDVALSAATTITTGNLTAVAGNNVVVSAASTVTTGDMVFRADNDGTGPGALAGTVAITCGINCLTITTGELNIRFNPVTYASTAAEIAAYGVNLTGGGTLDAKAWVFGQGDDKMYDGTTVATVSGLMPDEAGITPAVTLGAVSNAHFDTKHVGTDKPITFETTFTNAVFDLFAPVGMAAGTYQASADITRRPLSVNAVTDTRVYNGTTSSTGTPTVLALQTGDTLNGTLTQAFASKDVMGPGGSTLVADGPYSVNDGNGGNNYTVTVNTAAGTITPAALVGSITADDKLYDGNNAAVIASRTLATVFAGDSVIYTGGTAQFNDPNAGNNKTVTGTGLSLAGADAGNYTVNSTANTTADITPAPLVVTADNQTKPYGTVFAFAGTEFTSSGLVNAETIGSATLVSSGAAASAHVAGGAPYPVVPSDATGGSFNPANYTINYVNGAMVVTPAQLVVTADNQTKSYGTLFPFTGTEFTSSGLLNADTIGSATLVSAGTPATASVAGSPYSIVASDATGGTFTPGDYTISYVNGSMVVTPAPLVVTADNQTKPYGTTFAFAGTEFTSTGLVNADTIGSATLVSAGAPAAAHVAGSPYPIVPSDATGGSFNPANYTISYVNGAMVITPAQLVVTADNQIKSYGTVFPFNGTEFTASGLVNADTIGSATLVSAGTPATASVAGSPYSIVASDATGGTFTPGDYTISYVNGSMVVTPAPLVVTADNQTKPYGTTFAFAGTEFTSTGLVNADTIGSATLVSAGAPAAAHVAGSPYPIVPSDATGGSFNPANYTISYVNGAMVITPAQLVVTADNQIKSYGTVFPFNGTEFTASGLVNADTIGSATLVSAGTPATASVAGSPYSIVPSDATGGTFTPGDYTISYVNGSMVVTPVPLVVTADNQTKPYGTTFAFAGTEFTSTGLVNADTIGSATLVSAGAPAAAHVAGSPYPVVPSDATGGSFNPANYTISYVNGAMVITPAPLVVTANNQTKPYGTAFPFTGTEFTSSGLVNADTIGSATLVSAGTPATAPVAGSPYPIVPSDATGGTFTPGDYTISYVNGVMTVTPVALTLTANDATKVFGQTLTLPPSAFTAEGLVNGDTIDSVVETSPGTVASAPVVGSPYAIDITPGSAAGGTFVPSNYVTVYQPGDLTVTPVVVAPPVNVLPNTPYEGPVVTPPVNRPWAPVVVPANTPPQLLALVPPVSPPVVTVVQPVAPPVVQPMVQPAVQPVEVPPTPYLAPKRAPKQDRH